MQQLSGILKVNLDSVRKNWRLLSGYYVGQDCGAVVKTNAYGMGVARIAQSLFDEGCRTFFVANYQEGIELRKLLLRDVDIYVLQGCSEGMEQKFVESQLIPVLISYSMYSRWLHFAKASHPRYQVRCAIKVNTGMNRLGMSLEEFAWLVGQPRDIESSGVELVISHLACADQPDHQLNQLQLKNFDYVVNAIRKVKPSIKASLVNSAGIFLDTQWQFDLARPGIALFGGSMSAPKMPRFHQAISLLLPVLQVRQLNKSECVGYGATFCADRDMRIAIAAGGYGDGLLRALSGITSGWFHKFIPLLGRVSMDSCIFDVTDLSEQQMPKEGSLIEVIGEHCLLDDVAQRAGTISYELLTRMGDRLQKQYHE